MEIWVRVKTEEQLQAVLESQVHPKHLILDAALFSEAPDCVQMINRQAAETKVYLQLVIKNLDELGLVLETRTQEQLEIIGDAFLYAYNNDALRFYRELIPEMKFIYSDEN